MKLTTTQIEAFSAVLNVGSATGAASILNTSQPSVSRAIRQLEDATGLRLFDRSRGGFTPTSAARELAVTIEESFKGLGDIRNAAEAIRKRETKLIRIACLPAFSQGFLAGTVRALISRDPTVSVSMQSLLSRNVREAIHKRQIDIGIAAYEVDDPNLSIHRFTTFNEVALLPAEHRLARRQRISPEDLAGERLILLSKFDPYRSRLDNVLDAAGIQPAHLIEVETSSAACSAVAARLGIAIVNPVTALESLHHGLVMRRFAHDLPFVTTIISAKGASHPSLVQTFHRLLLSELQATKLEIDQRLAAPATGN